MYVDGASNARGSRVKIFMITPEGLRLEKSLRLGFRASNNEAEYEALIASLRAVQKLGAEEVDVFSDSKLGSKPNRRKLQIKGFQYVIAFEVVWGTMSRLPKSKHSQSIEKLE